MQHNYKTTGANNLCFLKNGWLIRSLNYIGGFVGFLLIASSLINAVISLQNQHLKKTAYLVVKNRSIELEVARTAEEQARGLMNRYDLNGKGMLFPVQPPKVVSVWMKNVRVPLDIVFVRQGRVVAIAHSTPPCYQQPCPIYKPLVPVNTVIELPAGMAGKLGLSVGVENLLFTILP